MKITRTYLKRIFRELGLTELSVAISKLKGAVHTSIDTHNLIFKEKFYPADMQSPEFSKHQHFNIYLNENEEVLVKKHFPELFLPTDFKATLEEAPLFVRKIETLNQSSPRKREIVFSQDLLKETRKNLPVMLYAGSHESLTYAHLGKLKKELSNDEDFKLPLSYAENGILVYSQKEGKDYSMLKDICQAIEKLKINYEVITDTTQFIERFKKSSIRLSILTYSRESFKSKQLYVMIKNQDPLAKVLEIDELKREVLSPLHESIENLYYADYFYSLMETELKKPMLTFEKEEELKKELFKLIANYQAVKHVKLLYIVHKVSEHFDISQLHFLMKKLPTQKIF